MFDPSALLALRQWLTLAHNPYQNGIVQPNVLPDIVSGYFGNPAITGMAAAHYTGLGGQPGNYLPVQNLLGNSYTAQFNIPGPAFHNNHLTQGIVNSWGQQVPPNPQVARNSDITVNTEFDARRFPWASEEDIDAAVTLAGMGTLNRDQFPPMSNALVLENPPVSNNDSLPRLLAEACFPGESADDIEIALILAGMGTTTPNQNNSFLENPIARTYDSALRPTTYLLPQLAYEETGPGATHQSISKHYYLEPLLAPGPTSETTTFNEAITQHLQEECVHSATHQCSPLSFNVAAIHGEAINEKIQKINFVKEAPLSSISLDFNSSPLGICQMPAIGLVREGTTKRKRWELEEIIEPLPDTNGLLLSMEARMKLEDFLVKKKCGEKVEQPFMKAPGAFVDEETEALYKINESMNQAMDRVIRMEDARTEASGGSVTERNEVEMEEYRNRLIGRLHARINNSVDQNNALFST